MAGLWWQHVTIVWWSYPLLAALLLLVALRGRLPLTPQAHSHLNTNTVAALAILPLVWVRLHLDLPWHGLTVAAVVALGLLYARRSAAARCLPAPALPPGSAAVPDQPPGESAGLPPLVDKPQDAATAIPFDAGVAAGHGQPAAAGGTLPLPAGRPGGQPAVLIEDVYAQRWWLLQGALAHGLMVAGYVNSVAALKGADRGWLFLAVALTAWAAMYALQRRRQPALEVTAPIVLTATLTALALTRVDDAAFALTLIGSAAGALVLYPVTCRVMSLLVPLTFAFAAMAAGRAALGLPEWTLAPAWAGVALALTATLTRWRRYSGSRLQEVEQAALALTALPWVAALAAALLALRATPAGQGRIQDTAQWLALTVVITLMGTVVTADGLRPAVRLRPLWTAGSAMLLLALLLAIGIWGPSNAIFYIAPAGAYLIGLGLTFRRSPPLFGDQMFGHEALHFAGSLLIGLTLLAQSFTGIGGSLSLQALLWGVLFLAAGFALTTRWLVVSGVLLLTGVALRFLQEFSDQTPLWLWLGITGTLLLVAGFMLLFLREQWDRVRRAISRWWLTSAPRDGE